MNRGYRPELTQNRARREKKERRAIGDTIHESVRRTGKVSMIQSVETVFSHHTDTNEYERKNDEEVEIKYVDKSNAQEKKKKESLQLTESYSLENVCLCI